MLENSRSLRGIKFAFLFGPPRFITRDEASKVYGAICDSTHLDDFSFKYSTIEPGGRLASKGFSIVLERKEGRGALVTTIDNKDINDPVRILLEYTWPPSIDHAKEHFDGISKSVFECLKGDWTKVLAEVRLRTQYSARSKSGLTFLRKRVLGLPDQFISGLEGPLSFCSVNLEVDGRQPAGEDQIEGAKRQLLIEVLREDPTSVYLELVSNWPQLAPSPRNQTGQIVVGNIRQIDSKPSEYIDEALSFLDKHVKELDRISKE